MQIETVSDLYQSVVGGFSWGLHEDREIKLAGENQRYHYIVSKVNIEKDLVVKNKTISI